MTDGIILIDKPIGVSSAYFSRKVGRCLTEKRAGHGGTLDPMASGLLVVMIGQATRLSRFLLSGDKQYIATAVFGVRSTTLDAEGELTATTPPPTDLIAALQQVIPTFIGNIQQTPPMTSAIKYQGKRLYHYARAGINIPIPSRAIHIKNIELLSADNTHIQLSVHCSGGTYIRSIIRDLAQAIGCDAYMSALRRIASTPYHIDDAVSWDDLNNASTHQRQAMLHCDNRLLLHLPAHSLSLHDIQRLGNGQRLYIPTIQNYTEESPPTIFRIVDDNNRLAGIARYDQQVMHPICLFHWTRQMN